MVWVAEEKPLVGAVVDWLLGYDAAGETVAEASGLLRVEAGVVALDHVLVVVPTGEAGRRLRRALAARARKLWELGIALPDGSRFPAALVPPVVKMPRLLLPSYGAGPMAAGESSASTQRVATRAEALMALTRCLRALRPGELAALVRRPKAGLDGQPPPPMSFASALAQAKKMSALWDALWENGLLCADVSAFLSAGRLGNNQETGSAFLASPPDAVKVEAEQELWAELETIDAESSGNGPFSVELRARWKDLATLEQRFFALLEGKGLAHPNTALRHLLEDVLRPERRPHAVQTLLATAGLEKIECIVLPGLPDAIPAFYRLTEAIARQGLAVTTLIHGNSEVAAALFDRWGRPLATSQSPWRNSATSPLAQMAAQRVPVVRRLADPTTQAQEAAELYFHDPAPMRTAGKTPQNRDIALAMLDSELEAVLLPLFAAPPPPPGTKVAAPEGGVTLYNPAQRPLATSSLGRLLARTLPMLAPNPSFADLSAFLRLADVRGCLGRLAAPVHSGTNAPEDLHVSSALATLDDLQRQSLPESLSDLKAALAQKQENARPEETEYRNLATLLERFEELRCKADQEAEAGGGGEMARLLALLRGIYRSKSIRSDRPWDRELESAAAIVRQTVLEIRSLEALGLAPAPDESAQLLTALLAGATYSLDAAPEARPALGWLELPWCEEPRLVVTGFDEGCIPAPLETDALLPDGLRAALGLPCDARRLVRDAFVLREILACRLPGDVALLCERNDQRGNTRRPSRLLFHVPDQDLPARAHELFQDPAARASGERPSLPAAWKLQLPLPGKAIWTQDHQRGPIHRLSVTDFSSYLATPLGFYLQKVFGDSGRDGVPLTEMPANDFGTLCHAALQSFAQSSHRDATDSSAIERFVLDAFEHEFSRQLGASPVRPVLLLQKEAARQRLRWFAARQAELRAEGWRILAAETLFDLPADTMLVDGIKLPLAIRGRADRIDVKAPATPGALPSYRVLDYKTWPKFDAQIHSFKSTVIPAGLSWPDDALANAQNAVADGGVQAVHLEASAKAQSKGAYWTDLQLPLYQLLAHAVPFARVDGSAPAPVEDNATVNAGYFVLGNTEKDTQLRVFDFSPEGMKQAENTLQTVVRRVQAGLFLPLGKEVAFARRTGELCLLPATQDPLADGIDSAWLADQRQRRVQFLAAQPSSASAPSASRSAANAPAEQGAE